MKTIIAAASFAVGAALAFAPAQAGDESFGLSPAACEESVSHFMSERLYDARSARFELDGAPYRVMVELRGGQQVTGWAQEVRVKSRLPSGSWSNYQPYTVIFKDGQPIALESDVSDITAI